MKLVVALMLFSSLSFGLSVEFCRVVRDWQQNRFGYQELCATGGNSCFGLAAEGQAICLAGNGRYCSNVTNTGQALCTIGEGSYCSSVKNIAQGICSVLKGEQCLYRNDVENFVWIRKLEDACRY